MALSKSKQFKYFMIIVMNHTVYKIIKIDLYGVRILGIQFTPKDTAHALRIDGVFSASQLENFNIKLLFNSVYMFIPK